MSLSTRRPRIHRSLPVAVISMLVGTGVAAAIRPRHPNPLPRLDCVAYDSTGKCEIAGVVYAITQIGGRTH